jgi:hypothetical protein
VGDEAAEVERVGLAQLPVQRLQPRLLHEQLLQLRGAPGRCNPRRQMVTGPASRARIET